MSTQVVRPSPAPEQSAICAVVLNWNAADDTIACVHSLQQLTSSKPDILIVDNGSTDGSADLLSKAFPTIRILKLPSNLGYAGGNNAGIRGALTHSYEFILILNNDTIAEEGFTESLVKVLCDDPLTGVTTPKILYMDRPSFIYSAGGSESLLTCSGVAGGQGREESTEGLSAAFPRPTDFASGCAMMVRREIFEEIGLFDDRFFMYFEDLEFSSRVRQVSRIVYVPSSRLLHKVGAGPTWGRYSPLYHYFYTRNRLWYFRQKGLIARVYSVCFTLVNVLLKSGAILAAMRPTPPGEARTRLKALWRGFWDGLVSESGSTSSGNPMPDFLRRAQV